MIRRRQFPTSAVVGSADAEGGGKGGAAQQRMGAGGGGSRAVLEEDIRKLAKRQYGLPKIRTAACPATTNKGRAE
jgi:hypothetical protein